MSIMFNQIYIYISNWRKSQPGFEPIFEILTCLATLKSCDTMKKSVCGWQDMLPHPHEVELSSEGISGCHLRNATLFEWIQHSVAVSVYN